MEPAVLGHYLTFVHYFGFSIKPNSDRSGLDKNVGAKLAYLMKISVKFNAIGLTAFLALNHLVVLLDYVLQGDKVLTELMLEARLVITKFSALIFVLLWHFKQSQVRQLIELVQSTSLQVMQGNGHDRVPATREKQVERRVMRWWIMCLSITALHFGLSEAEVTSSHHLWQWLDDYSLHRLNNQTTSLASLMLMASVDNYIYTVHVYGTRLIGASVICLVCSLQSDNIRSLTRHALGQTRPTCLGAAGRVPATELGPSASLFVLGESSWLRAEEARRRLPSPGYLSGRLSLAAWRRRANGAKVHTRCATHESWDEPTHRGTTPWPARNLLRRAWESPTTSAEFGRRPPLGTSVDETGSGRGHLESELEQLAARYELVRTANERIDACFGPTLLIQYSALFLMSCIDVVYFSICLNPNTKTKYIIISGMILLWWPYLLLYKYASDIGSRSKELLTSVRRLARLALLERLQLHSKLEHETIKLMSTRLSHHRHEPIYLANLLALTTLTAPRAAQKWPLIDGGPIAAAGEPANAIVNKLDHVFKATHLSIMGILVVDKFFLLNFAKIVITASVMIIQFIT